MNELIGRFTTLSEKINKDIKLLFEYNKQKEDRIKVLESEQNS